MSKIAEYTHFVGIDVSMDWLDVHMLPGDLRFRAANTSRGGARRQRAPGFPLSPHNVDDPLNESWIEMSPATVRFWWHWMLARLLDVSVSNICDFRYG